MPVTCPACGAHTDPGPDADPRCGACGAELPTDAPSPDEPTSPGAGAPSTDELSVDEPTNPSSEPPPGGAADASAEPPPPPPPHGGAAPPPPGGIAPARPSPYDPSHPSGLSESVRNYGMFTHLSAFAGALVTLAFVGPLILWLIRRDEHPFLDHHGKEAVNFNLSLLLYGVVGVVVSVLTVGLGLLVFLPGVLVFFVLWVWATIQAAIKASRGEGFRYPLTIRFIQD